MNRSFASVLACGICFVAGAWTSPWWTLPSAAGHAQANPAVVLTMRGRLASNAYQQTSAEYVASCLQIYRCAEDRLRELVTPGRRRVDRPAVVMDLDETVLDNSTFQTFLLQNDLEYSDARWAVYEESFPDDVRLVPGARQFIQKAEDFGVTVVYLSNRSEALRASTRSALQRHGIAGVNLEERLFLKPVGGSSDKSARREQVMTRYNVLMWFGDNLRDFSEVFAAPKPGSDADPAAVKAALANRRTHAETAGIHWGVDWFVLPNPVYGEWDRMLGPQPLEVLNETRMTRKDTGDEQGRSDPVP